MDIAHQGINNIGQALRAAKRGDAVVYHKGPNFDLAKTRDLEIKLIRNIVWELYENKKCIPVQRKVNIYRQTKDGKPAKTRHIFEYIAVFI